MNARRSSTRRADRAALGATFAAAILTVALSAAAMVPAATPLTASLHIAALTSDMPHTAESAPSPCTHVATPAEGS
jgi:hypothetical protein